MKSCFTKGILGCAVLATTLASSLAFSEGGTSMGGGGGYIQKPNGTIENGDNQVDFLEVAALPDNVQRILNNASVLLQRYGLTQVGNSLDFVRDYIRNPHVTYNLVDTLPCRDSDMSMVLAVDEKGETGGCIDPNNPNITYLLRKVIQNPKLNAYALVTMLVHERLHAVPGNPKHASIIQVAAGIRRALELYEQELAGSTPNLSAKDYGFLRRMALAIQDMGLSRDLGFGKHEMADFQVVQNGGGFVQDGAKVDPTAYVGVGSVLRSDALVEDGAVIAGSDLSNVTLHAGRKSTIRASEIKGATSESSQAFDFAIALNLGANATMESTRLRLTTFIQDPASYIFSKSGHVVNFTMTAGDNSLLSFSGAVSLGDIVNVVDDAYYDHPSIVDLSTFDKSLTVAAGARVNYVGKEYQCVTNHAPVWHARTGRNLWADLTTTKNLDLLGTSVQLASEADIIKLCRFGRIVAK